MKRIRLLLIMGFVLVLAVPVMGEDIDDICAVKISKMGGLYSKWGFINKRGDIIIEPEYDDVHLFSEPFQKT